MDLTVRLGRRLDDVAAIDPAFLELPDNVERLRLVLAYLKAGQRLRCLHWLAAKREKLFRLVLGGADSPTGTVAEHDLQSARALRASLGLLRRHGVLQQMFSPARVSLVLEMISSTE
ncbi:hypothetical protein CWS72_24065 [Telmatospirillum siberiense]|uniref:Uncharacterized protein n=2 Tax=Telmatospirillum siberiense TaxID=382514 RepID=A0A2N3PNJ3_9PROT|nr:hypothetical protein CWS72_24065 [Telmatospirillum siberiense]